MILIYGVCFNHHPSVLEAWINHHARIAHDMKYVHIVDQGSTDPRVLEIYHKYSPSLTVSYGIGSVAHLRPYADMLQIILNVDEFLIRDTNLDFEDIFHYLQKLPANVELQTAVLYRPTDEVLQLQSIEFASYSGHRRIGFNGLADNKFITDLKIVKLQHKDFGSIEYPYATVTITNLLKS